MSKQYTVITKDGSKWLRPFNPHPEKVSTHWASIDIPYYCPEWQEFEKNNFDVPYLGTKPEGTTLDEREVREVRQYEYKGEWFNCDYHPFYRAVKRNPNIQTRTVYTDAESHARRIKPFNTQNVRPLVNQLVGEEISFSRFIELLNEIANELR